MSTEQDLQVFFDGLEAGLNSYRHVQALYDEQVAFGFNYTNLFEPNENRTSKVLAFILDPNKPHGQKTTFLKLFVELFELKVPPSLFEDEKQIAVHTPYTTTKRRSIDLTIHFGNNNYVIGIENKIWEAKDQKNQLQDYAAELEEITRPYNNWVLFYLTRRDGGVPWEGSITPKRRDELGEKFKSKSWKDIRNFLEQCELVCKADNVRAFLKDFKQYINRYVLQEAIMSEQQLINDYVRNHPSIIGNLRPLNAALDTLTAECREKLCNELKKQLESNGMCLCPTDDGGGGGKSRDWFVTKPPAEILKFGETRIDIRIQVGWWDGGLALFNGVCSKPPVLSHFYELVKKATTENDYDGRGDGWDGGCYDVDRLTDEKLIQLLKDPDELSKTVSSWVPHISNYIDIVVRVCKEQQ